VDELLKSAKPVSGKTPRNPAEVRKSEITIISRDGNRNTNPKGDGFADAVQKKSGRTNPAAFWLS
jgi:hypothetical protein